MNANQTLEASFESAINAQTQRALSCALAMSRRTGYATAPYVHFTERDPQLRETFADMIERGVPLELCTFDRVNSVAAQIAETGDVTIRVQK